MEEIEKRASEIKERISSFFELSLSFDTIPLALMEEKLCWSAPFRELERGRPELLLKGECEDLFKEVFDTPDIPNHYTSNSIDAWIGEAYASIFLSRHVSFSRILLLLPLREMKDLFYPYHEMDSSQILNLYSEREKSVSILEALKKRNHLTYQKIAEETGIPLPSLFRYRNNESLDKISLSVAKKLSLALSCPMECFLPRLDG